MDLAAAHFGKTVTAQPHELDPRAGSDPVECADEVGDKHRCALEQRDDDEVGRGLLRDLGGERLDPRGDLRLADKSAYTLHLQTPKRPGRIAKLCPVAPRRYHRGWNGAERKIRIGGGRDAFHRRVAEGRAASAHRGDDRAGNHVPARRAQPHPLALPYPSVVALRAAYEFGELQDFLDLY